MKSLMIESKYNLRKRINKNYNENSFITSNERETLNLYKQTKEDYLRMIIKRCIAKALKKFDKRNTFVFNFLVERSMHKQLMKQYNLNNRYRETSFLEDFRIEDEYNNFQIINFKIKNWKQRLIQDQCSPLGVGIKFDIHTDIALEDENINVVNKYIQKNQLYQS